MSDYTMDEIEEIFYDLEVLDDRLKPEKPISKKVIVEKRNKFNLTEKETELICLLFCGGLFLILFTGLLVGYMFYYFSL